MTTTRPRMPATRRVAAGLAVVYLGFLLFTVFWPLQTYSSGSIDATTRTLHSAGAPESVTPSLVEFLGNIALFIPFSLLGAILTTRWSWQLWLVTGACASALIELTQLFYLPDRSATVFDVVANSLGAFLGVLLARRLRLMLR